MHRASARLDIVRFKAGRNDCLEQLGIQVLSFAQLDYVTKARGGTGEDGVKWDEVTRATIEARVRSRTPAKRIVQQRRDLAEAEAAARQALRALADNTAGAAAVVS